ncbi:MAG: hypothetical protein ACLQVD_18595 [Capsulimonadaceae bacterium]
MTIGDILAVIAAVALTAASWGATLLMTGLLFPGCVGRARQALSERPAACVGRGVVLVVVVAAVGVVFHGAGPLRLIPLLLWSVLVLFAAFGSSAVVEIMDQRMDVSPEAGFARRMHATALYVGAGFVPIVGWFLVTPIAAVTTLGAGAAAFGNARRPVAGSGRVDAGVGFPSPVAVVDVDPSPGVAQ